MAGLTSVLLTPDGPYDLALSLRAGRSFNETSEEHLDPHPSVLRVAVWHGEVPLALGVEQVEPDPPVLEASWSLPGEPEELRGVAERVVRADLDLRPFYDRLREVPLPGDPLSRLHGLKPFRPASLFEMAVTAVIEQQISLAAAYRIRGRLVRRFGGVVDGLLAFPLAESLADAPLEALRACGLSGRKSEYVRDLAVSVASGEVDLDGLVELSDAEVVEYVTSLRGFGRWSAEYLLVRGIGRVDVVPGDDLGVRTVVGRHLGGGARVSPEEVHRLLEPWRPYRGLATFYLLAAERLGLLE